MNELEKIFNEKKTENGDKSYKSTGDNLTDLFFMTPYFEKNLDEVKIGTTILHTPVINLTNGDFVTAKNIKTIVTKEQFAGMEYKV